MAFAAHIDCTCCSIDRLADVTPMIHTGTPTNACAIAPRRRVGAISSGDRLKQDVRLAVDASLLRALSLF